MGTRDVSTEALRLPHPANASPENIQMTVAPWLPWAPGSAVFAALTGVGTTTYACRGQYMITPTPTRQMVAPIVSGVSGWWPSIHHPQRRDSTTNTPP